MLSLLAPAPLRCAFRAADHGAHAGQAGIRAEKRHHWIKPAFEAHGLAYDPPPDVVPNTQLALRVTELARDRGLPKIGPLVLAPSSIAVVSLGIGLVFDSNAWHVSEGWLILALALFAAAFVIGAAFQSRAALALQRAIDAGNRELAARQLRRWAWGMRLILVLLVVITWDMVAKPTL